jgi:RNA polymerase sigma-70 factor (ECF subfamily)
MADASPSSVLLQACLDRLRAGDNKARTDLLEHCQRRFRQLARRMFKSFDRLRPRVDTDDVVQGAMVRLWRALDNLRPIDVLGFSRLSAKQIRRELIDLARKHHRRQPLPLPGGDQSSSAAEHQMPSDSTFDPGKLALWTEFHEQVEKLPEAEFAVYDLLWYQGMEQKEAAELLGVSVPTVKLRWRSARLLLPARLPMGTRATH